MYAREINNRISFVLECIENAFKEYEINSHVPTKMELKEFVKEKLGRIKKEETEEIGIQSKTLQEIFDDFLVNCSKERSWADTVYHKYVQAWNHLKCCDPEISLEKLNKNKMTELKEWYIKNGYRNRTTTKQLNILKSFLRWIDTNGYPVKKEVLEYKPNLTVTKKTVTFLKTKELLHFASFEFPMEKKYLDKARDMFCFMSFTSLRYSDLKALKKAYISDGQIEMYTQKTSDKIRIPIIEYAQKIIDKYSVYNFKDGSLFPVPSNQKLNDYLKEAAELAGLDREVVDTYFIGTKRYDELYKFHDRITCHDARRSFVCCSIALGIPTTTVMTCTGHKDFESMKPYIEIGDDTQRLQMDKWNGYHYKTDIIESLNRMSPEQLQRICEYIKNIA